MDQAEIEQAAAVLESPDEPDEEQEEEEMDGHVSLKVGETDLSPRKKYICTYLGCDKSFDWKSYWERHMQTHTGEKPYGCTFDGCEYRCAQTGNLKVHMRSHEKALAKEGVLIEISSADMPQTLVAGANEDGGIKLIHLGSPVQEETPKKPRKKRQSKTDSSPKVWTCEHEGCGKQFFWKSYRDRHEQIHTGVKPFVCTWPECYYRTTQSGNLKMHMQKHTGEKPYPCTWIDCSYRSTHPGNLKNHMQTHTGVKPYKCKEPGCEYAAAANETLKQHMRTHTVEGCAPDDLRSEKPFGCPWEGCSYRSAQAGTLAIHYQTHTGIKPFACGYVSPSGEGCGYRSSHACHVRKHFLIHTGEKPYRCEVLDCPYRAASKDALNRHMRAHKGEKPFKCDFTGCDMSFSAAGSLRRHVLTHTGEKPYKCVKCEYTAAQNETVTRHYKSKHTEKSDTRGLDEQPETAEGVEGNEEAVSSHNESVSPQPDESIEMPEPLPVELPVINKRKRKPARIEEVVSKTRKGSSQKSSDTILIRVVTSIEQVASSSSSIKKADLAEGLEEISGKEEAAPSIPVIASVSDSVPVRTSPRRRAQKAVQ